MTTPTRQEIINAHEALSEITYLADTYLSSISGRLDETRELRQTILAALPPKPRPTMAEVEWDDEKHRFAEAEHPIWGRSIMIFQSVDTGNILIEFRENGERSLFYTPPASLTPTGKRYTLTEVQDG